jgi:hypothetical protein
MGPDRDKVIRRYSTLLVEGSPAETRGGTGYVCRATTTDGQVIAVKQSRALPASDGLTEEDWKEVQEKALFEEYRMQLVVSGRPGFPRVYGYGTTSTGPVILMEWVDGITLRKARPLLPTEGSGVCANTVCDLGICVLRILIAANDGQTRLVHRDISPRNIMLRTSKRGIGQQISTGDYDLVLIDFGSSSTSGPSNLSLTMRSDIWRNGTPEYAPPEMLTSDMPSVGLLRRSPKVDTYALCSVLYELYCSRTPFRLSQVDFGGASPYRVKVDYEPYDMDCHQECDRPLCEAIMTGLAASQDERPTTLELLEAFQAWRDGAACASADVANQALARAEQPVQAQTAQSAGGRHATRRAFLAAACAVGAGALAAVAYARQINPLEGWRSLLATITATPVTSAQPYAWPAQDAGSNLWGIASTNGSWLMQPAVSHQPGSWSAHGTPVEDDASGLWGYVTDDGTWAIEPKLSAAGPFSDDGFAAAQASSGLWGIIRPNGSWAVEPAYTGMGLVVSNGCVAFMDGSYSDKWGLLGTDGGWAFKPSCDALGTCGDKGLIAARWGDTRWGYVRKKDALWAVNADFVEAREFSEGLAPCRIYQDDTYWVFINTSEQVIISSDLGLVDARPISEGAAAAQEASSGLWGFVNASNSWVVSPTFGALGDLHNGLAAAQDASSRLWGLVDSYGDWQVQPTFAGMVLGSLAKDQPA